MPDSLLFAAAFAFADSSNGCDAAASTLQCRLDKLLTTLEAAAWVLGVVLVVVLAIAVRYYRRSKHVGPPEA